MTTWLPPTWLPPTWLPPTWLPEHRESIGPIELREALGRPAAAQSGMDEKAECVTLLLRHR